MDLNIKGIEMGRKIVTMKGKMFIGMFVNGSSCF